MAATNADVVAAMAEKVRPQLGAIYEKGFTGVAKLIQRASESHKISAWNATLSTGQTLGAFRVPLQRYEGGDYGTYDPNEGDLGGGSMTKVEYMSFSYFPARFAVEVPQLTIDATASSEQSVINVWKTHLKDAMHSMLVYYDTGLHGDGTGVLATGAGTGTPSNAGQATSTTTFALEANAGAQRLRLNQPVDVYSAALDTKRTATPVRVKSIDHIAKTVTTVGIITSPANDDRIAFPGMAATLAVGSWRNGIFTFNNSATSGYTGTLDRSVVTELVPPSFAAGGANLTPSVGLLLNDQLIQRRDPSALTGLKGIAHMAQRAAWYQQGILFSEWKRGGNDKMFDIVPGDIQEESTFVLAGVDHLVSKKQSRDRIDWIIPKNYCRALLHDLKWFESPDGRKFFELRSTTTGNPKAGFLMYMVSAEQIVSVDPGCGAFASGLALPSGM